MSESSSIDLPSLDGLLKTHLASVLMLGFAVVYSSWARQSHELSFGATVNQILRALTQERRIGKTIRTKSKYVFTKTKEPYVDAHAVSSWAWTLISYTGGPCTTQDQSCIP
jgi:hypothetical protein